MSVIADNCVDELKVDFLNVFKMIETVAPLRGSYDPWLMGTSVAIAVLAAFTALSISSRMVAAAYWQAGQRRSLQHGRRPPENAPHLLAFSLPSCKR
jgi:hypothetical protein